MSAEQAVITGHRQQLPITTAPEEPLEVLLRAGLAEGFHMGVQLKDSISVLQPAKRSSRKNFIGNAPATAQFERAAEIQLQKWRDSAFLPSEAQAMLCDANSETTAEGEGWEGSPLLLRVARVFRRFFAWEGRLLLDAEIVLDLLESEDEMADRLAAFLWANRHAVE